MDEMKIMRLKDMACKAMDEIDENDLKRPEGAAMAKNLASLMLKLDEIAEADMGGYSGAGDWRAEGNYSRARGYSRNAYGMGGYSGRRDSMGRYSRGNGSDQMIAQLEDMLQEADEHERGYIEKAIHGLKNIK